MQADKGNFARIVDQFAAYWTPITVSVAFLITFVPVVLAGQDFHVWLHKSLVY